VFSIVFPIVLFSLVVILNLALAVVLICKYLRTRDAGFIWLGVAVVIWPLISGMVDRGIGKYFVRLRYNHLPGLYPFSLVERGQMSIGTFFMIISSLQRLIEVALLVVAVLYLRNTKSDRNLQAL